jgi:hypothetical protein
MLCSAGKIMITDAEDSQDEDMNVSNESPRPKRSTLIPKLNLHRRTSSSRSHAKQTAREHKAVCAASSGDSAPPTDQGKVRSRFKQFTNFTRRWTSALEVQRRVAQNPDNRCSFKIWATRIRVPVSIFAVDALAQAG